MARAVYVDQAASLFYSEEKGETFVPLPRKDGFS
jgi:hypothetical protein